MPERNRIEREEPVVPLNNMSVGEYCIYEPPKNPSQFNIVREQGHPRGIASTSQPDSRLQAYPYRG